MSFRLSYSTDFNVYDCCNIVHLLVNKVIDNNDARWKPVTSTAFSLDHRSLKQPCLLNSLYVSGLRYGWKVASGLDVSVDSRINLRAKKIYSIHR